MPNDETNRRAEVMLGLGANLGDPLRQLAAAVEAIRGFMDDVRVSSVYRTEPVGYADQPHRYYDRERRDWHEWNERESRAYRHWLMEERRERRYREYARLRAEEQRAYWRWRHEHRDWR